MWADSIWPAAFAGGVAAIAAAAGSGRRVDPVAAGVLAGLSSRAFVEFTPATAAVGERLSRLAVALSSPTEARGWLPAVAGAVLVAAGWRRRAMLGRGIAFAACLVTPWLLLGRSVFVTERWSTAESAARLGTCAGVLVAIAWLTEGHGRRAPAAGGFLRLSAFCVTLAAAAAAVGATGSLTYAEWAAVPAAAVAGVAIGSWRRDDGRAADLRGAAIVASALLGLATAYSRLPGWAAAGLAVAMSVTGASVAFPRGAVVRVAAAVGAIGVAVAAGVGG